MLRGSLLSNAEKMTPSLVPSFTHANALLPKVQVSGSTPGTTKIQCPSIHVALGNYFELMPIFPTAPPRVPSYFPRLILHLTVSNRRVPASSPKLVSQSERVQYANDQIQRFSIRPGWGEKGDKQEKKSEIKRVSLANANPFSWMPFSFPSPKHGISPVSRYRVVFLSHSVSLCPYAINPSVRIRRQ